MADLNYSLLELDALHAQLTSLADALSSTSQLGLTSTDDVAHLKVVDAMDRFVSRDRKARQKLITSLRALASQVSASRSMFQSVDDDLAQAACESGGSK